MVASPGIRHWLIAVPLTVLLASLLACAPSAQQQTKGPEPTKHAAEAKAPASAAPSGPAAKDVAALKVPAIAAPAGKKELILLQGSDTQGFDPHKSNYNPDVVMTVNLYDMLLDWGQDGKLKPALATEWKNVNDKTWQFKLRKGVKFHNGEPLTAETVEFSLDRTGPNGDPKAVTRNQFTTVDKIEVVDEYTVNVITKVPDPLLPARLASWGGQIIPKQYFEKVGTDEFNRKPVGTGPLKFVEWVKDDHATFEANKEWWGGKIDFEKVTFKPVPEAAARVAALLKGEADIITFLSPDDAERVKKSDNATVASAFYNGLYTINTNVGRGSQPSPFPLDNKYFRQALSLAIDRQAIVKELWRGQAVVPNGVYPKTDWCWDPNLPPLEYNPAKAKELLQKAGYKGEEVVLEGTIGYLTNEKEMSEAIVSMWREVGINAKLEMIEFSVRAQKNREKKFKGMWWGNPTSTMNDPDGMVYRLTQKGTPQDYLRIPEWDKLMEEARVTLDQAKRKELYDKAHKIYLEEHMQWIPVLQPYDLYGIQKFIDWQPRGSGDFFIEEVKLMRSGYRG